MSRTLTVVGVAAIAVLSAVAASQAQGPQNPQRGGRPGVECGPARGADDQTQGMQQGRGVRRGPQGAMLGRGPGAGRQGGIGRPGGPGRMGGRGFALCGLDLTDEQKTQIRALHQETRQQIEALLTPEQKAKLRARRGGGAGLDEK